MVMQVCIVYINTVLSLSRVSIEILNYPWRDDMIHFKLQETTYVRNILQAVPFWFGKSLHSIHIPKTELLWYLTCCRRTQLWANVVNYLTIHQGNDKCCVFFFILHVVFHHVCWCMSLQLGPNLRICFSHHLLFFWAPKSVWTVLSMALIWQGLLAQAG